MKHLTGVLLLVLTTMSTLTFAQAPETAPIIILPGDTMEQMPSTLPFDVRSLRAAGDQGTPPASYDEAKWLIADAASTAHKQKIVDTKIADVESRGNNLAAQIKIHNDQWPNGCVYPPDNPTFCDGWLQEAKEQNDTLKKLKAEYYYLVGVRGTLRSHQSIVLSRLRFDVFFQRFTAWEKRVVGCTFIKSPEAAQACLNDAWEVRP